MEKCEAQCSRCYYNDISNSNRTCQCYVNGYSYSHSTYSYNNNYNRDLGSRENVSLCRHCNLLNETELTKRREKRDLATFNVLVGQSLSCSTCKETLSRSSPLWWKCSTCHLECRSSHHPEWRRKLDV